MIMMENNPILILETEMPVACRQDEMTLEIKEGEEVSLEEAHHLGTKINGQE